MLTAADFVRHAFPLITHHINKQQNRSSGTSIIHAWPRLSHLCNKANYITPFCSQQQTRASQYRRSSLKGYLHILQDLREILFVNMCCTHTQLEPFLRRGPRGKNTLCRSGKLMFLFFGRKPQSDSKLRNRVCSQKMKSSTFLAYR